MLITPISSSEVNVGACVRLASTHVTWGRPIPTTATSPSWSSLAPAAAMISVARISTSGIFHLPDLSAVFRNYRHVLLAQRHRVTELRSTRRSEEHTSELQSQSNLVCRLLLEKKKNH